MTTLVPSFLNESSSFLQVTRTTIKAWMTLNFCKIQQLTTDHVFSVATEIIIFKLAGYEKIHNNLYAFELWPDWKTDNRVTCS